MLNIKLRYNDLDVNVLFSYKYNDIYFKTAGKCDISPRLKFRD